MYPGEIILFVSILVLMDLCIKTIEEIEAPYSFNGSFNPCFNGSMYKNFKKYRVFSIRVVVSILVLMDLCIKTLP